MAQRTYPTTEASSLLAGVLVQHLAHDPDSLALVLLQPVSRHSWRGTL